MHTPLHWLTARVAAMTPSPGGGHPMDDGQGHLLGGLDPLQGWTSHAFNPRGWRGRRFLWEGLLRLPSQLEVIFLFSMKYPEADFMSDVEGRAGPAEAIWHISLCA